jgi:hypothetical protein
VLELRVSRAHFNKEERLGKQRFLKRKISYNGSPPKQIWLCIYSSELTTPADIEELLVEAIKDFPWLTRKKIWIEKSDNQSSFPGHIGISFDISTDVEIPAEYRQQNNQY